MSVHVRMECHQLSDTISEMAYLWDKGFEAVARSDGWDWRWSNPRTERATLFPGLRCRRSRGWEDGFTHYFY